MVEISFITINYNSTNYTEKLIKSIEKETSLSYEIIIVDNNSRHNEQLSIKTIVHNKKHIRLIQNDINCGFSCANMIAAEKANGKYIFFINNDTILLNDVTYIFTKFFQANKQAVLLTGKILDDKNNFHSSYKTFPSIIKELFGNSTARLFNHFPSNKVKLKQPTKVEVISGSCMFFRRDIFISINGFDTNFFLYCEEEDISKRIWDAGHEIYFIPEASIYHKGGGSESKNYELLREYYISYIYLISKHFNLFSAKILLILMYIKIFRRSLSKVEYKKLLFDIKKENSLRYKQGKSL